MATEQVYVLLFDAVILVIASVAVLLYAIQRLRRRKAQLLNELKASPRLTSDRAFNRLVMARREVDILARQGTDVTRARELIAQSQASLDLRQFDRAYELAQSAHESLVAARQGTSGPPAQAPLDRMAPRASPRTPFAPGPLPSGAASAPLSSPSPPLAAPAPARNRIESQFEMRLLDSDLETARADRPSDPATLAAADFQGKAHTAFAAGEYTDAFRYALKGRRGLGGKVEAVAPGPGSASANSAVGPIDPSAAAERAAGAARCPNCGYPTTSDDAFCRGCGTPRTPTSCPKCGAARAPTDTFCGQCATRFS